MMLNRSQKMLWISLFMAVLLGFLWQLAPLPDAKERLSKLPLKGIGYQGKELSLMPYEEKFLKGANVIKREYEVNGQPFFITALDGTHNRHLVHDPYYCFRGSGWEIVSENSYPLPNGSASLLEIQKGEEKKQALFWFSDGKEIYRSPLRYWGETTLRRLTFGLSGNEPLLIVVQPIGNEEINWKQFSKTFTQLFQL